MFSERREPTASRCDYPLRPPPNRVSLRRIQPDATTGDGRWQKVREFGTSFGTSVISGPRRWRIAYPLNRGRPMTDTTSSPDLIAATVATLPQSAAERFGQHVAARYKRGDEWQEMSY